MAQPLPVVSSISQADAAIEGRLSDGVAFRLDPRISLADAEEIDNITRPGRDGFQLLYKELLECKKRTKIHLERAYQRMCDRCLEDCDKEIHKLDISISSLKQLIVIPNNDLPHVGPPREERNQGVQHVVKLPPTVGGGVLHRGVELGNHGTQRQSQGTRGAAVWWCAGIWTSTTTSLIFVLCSGCAPVVVAVEEEDRGAAVGVGKESARRSRPALELRWQLDGVRDGAPQYEPYPSYEEMGPESIPFLPPFSQESDKEAAIGRDQESYKEWLKLNLVFLEKRRQIVEEKKVSLERGLKAIVRDAMESRLMLGAGYHQNYNFVI